MGNLRVDQEQTVDFEKSFDAMKIVRQILDSLSQNCDDTSNSYSALIIAVLWLAVLKIYSDWFLEGAYYLRDVSAEVIQIILNALELTIKLVTGISFMSFEYLASISIVILLWVGATKMVINIAKKRPQNVRISKKYRHSRMTLS